MGLFRSFRDNVKHEQDKAFREIEKESRLQKRIEAIKAQHESKVHQQSIKRQIKEFKQERATEKRIARKQKIDSAKARLQSTGTKLKNLKTSASRLKHIRVKGLSGLIRR